MILDITFHDFIEAIFTPISYFVNWLKMVSNSLMQNYIFLFFLGLTILLTILYLLFNFVIDYLNHRVDLVEDEFYKNKNYELYKKVQSNYLNKHRTDEFDYLYNLSILKQQVLNGIYQKHSDLLLDNKVRNYKLNAQALRKLNDDVLSDNDPKNDNDIDYLVPNNVNKSKNKNKNDLIDNKLLDIFGNVVDKGTLEYVNNDLEMYNANVFTRDYILGKHSKDKQYQYDNFDKFKKYYAYSCKVDDFDKNFYISDGWIVDRLTGDQYPFVKNDLLPNIPFTDKSSVNELKEQTRLHELQYDHEILKSTNIRKIDRIFDENKDFLAKYNLAYNKIDNVFYDIATGEVIDLSKIDLKSRKNTKSLKNIITLGHFGYYDINSKEMKKIALPIINTNDDIGFQFDNDRLSDYEKNIITNHTMIRL